MLLETQVFEFGEYLLDLREGVLLQNGTPLSVPPKILQLLTVLIENQGHIVEKEKLMETVWEGSFVEDSNLTYSIRQLRKILGDDIRHPHFIETVPRRGYRFIARLEEKVGKRKFMVNGSLDLNRGRYENGDQTGFDIARPLAGKPITKSGYVVWSSIFAAVIFGFAAFFWLYPATKTHDDSALKFERVTSNGKTKFAAVSPDGKFIAYILEDEDQQSLWLKNIVAGSDVQILPTAENTTLDSLAFSPDGNFIHYVAGASLYQQPVLGGSSKKIVQDYGTRVQVNPVTFSPDGKQFAFIRQLPEIGTDLVIANADGTGERILASGRSPNVFLRSAAWSPDGKVIAVAGAGKVV